MTMYAIDTTFTCESVYGAKDGSATVVAAEGITINSYLWSTGETTATVNDLPTGWSWVRVNYDITVPDEGTENIVLFVQIQPCQQPYSFNMTDSELECFLQIASCRYGDKAHEYFDKLSQGIRDCCCDKELFMLMKNIETAACWNPNTNIGVEQPSYYAINFTSYNNSQNTTFSISFLNKTFSLPFITTNNLIQNLDAAVNIINADPVFKAQRDGNVLWILAPSGYGANRVPVTLSQTNVQIVYAPITTVGFQNGCIPSGSYVDWTGVLHTAPADCLDEDQVGNIIDNIKQYVDCECTAGAEIFDDSVDGAYFPPTSNFSPFPSQLPPTPIIIYNNTPVNIYEFNAPTFQNNLLIGRDPTRANAQNTFALYSANGGGVLLNYPDAFSFDAATGTISVPNNSGAYTVIF